LPLSARARCATEHPQTTRFRARRRTRRAVRIANALVAVRLPRAILPARALAPSQAVQLRDGTWAAAPGGGSAIVDLAGKPLRGDRTGSHALVTTATSIIRTRPFARCGTSGRIAAAGRRVSWPEQSSYDCADSRTRSGSWHLLISVRLVAWRVGGDARRCADCAPDCLAELEPAQLPRETRAQLRSVLSAVCLHLSGRRFRTAV
jgi:hypothetical protein